MLVKGATVRLASWLSTYKNYLKTSLCKHHHWFNNLDSITTNLYKNNIWLIKGKMGSYSTKLCYHKAKWCIFVGLYNNMNVIFQIMIDRFWEIMQLYLIVVPTDLKQWSYLSNLSLVALYSNYKYSMMLVHSNTKMEERKYSIHQICKTNNSSQGNIKYILLGMLYIIICLAHD